MSSVLMHGLCKKVITSGRIESGEQIESFNIGIDSKNIKMHMSALIYQSALGTYH